MDTKLTLKLDKEVIERAKLYARSRGLSLSRVVEGYLLGLTRDEEPTLRKLTGTVAELAGILGGNEADESKQAYAGYLARKYSARAWRRSPRNRAWSNTARIALRSWYVSTGSQMA